MAAPSPGTVNCPLCRTEIPVGARFCGECGQPLVAGDSLTGMSRDSLTGMSGLSLPAGMVRVPLVHGRAEAPVSAPATTDFPAAGGAEPSMAPTPAAAPAAPEPVPLPSPGTTPAQAVPLGTTEPAPAEPATGYEELATLDVEVDEELEEADTHFQFVEVDVLLRRGRFEEALERLFSVHGAPPGDPRLAERLGTIARDLGRGAAQRPAR